MKKTAIELFVIEVENAKRKKAGMTQAELAFELGVSLGFLGKVENIHTSSKFNLKHIDRLAEIFRCSPKDFLPESNLCKTNN